MENKGLVDHDPQKRLPPSYQSIVDANSLPAIHNPPPYFTQPVGLGYSTIIVQPSTTHTQSNIYTNNLQFTVYLKK